MSMIFQLRTFWLDRASTHRDLDALRRAGYHDGEPRPRQPRHWANG